MFLIMVTYKQPIEQVDQYLQAHRAFLEEGYQKDYFVVSGPKKPRTGGVIISQLSERHQLMKILEKDPFYQYDIADFEVIEFEPVKYHREFAQFVNPL